MARTKGRGRKNSGHWTEIESQLLHVGLERYGRDWHAISRFVGTRTPTQVKSKHQKVMLRLAEEDAAMAAAFAAPEDEDEDEATEINNSDPQDDPQDNPQDDPQDDLQDDPQDDPQDGPQDEPQDDIRDQHGQNQNQDQVQQGFNRYLDQRGGPRRSQRRRRSASYYMYGDAAVHAPDRRVRPRISSQLNFTPQVPEGIAEPEEDIMATEEEDDDEEDKDDVEQHGPVNVLEIRRRIRQEAANRAASRFSSSSIISAYGHFLVLPPPPGVEGPPELRRRYGLIGGGEDAASSPYGAAVVVSPPSPPRFTSHPPARAGSFVIPRAILSLPPLLSHTGGDPSLGASSLRNVDAANEDESTLRREAAEALMLL